MLFVKPAATIGKHPLSPGEEERGGIQRDKRPRMMGENETRSERRESLSEIGQPPTLQEATVTEMKEALSALQRNIDLLNKYAKSKQDVIMEGLNHNVEDSTKRIERWGKVMLGEIARLQTCDSDNQNTIRNLRSDLERGRNGRGGEGPSCRGTSVPFETRHRAGSFFGDQNYNEDGVFLSVPGGGGGGSRRRPSGSSRGSSPTPGPGRVDTSCKGADSQESYAQKVKQGKVLPKIITQDMLRDFRDICSTIGGIPEWKIAGDIRPTLSERECEAGVTMVRKEMNMSSRGLMITNFDFGAKLRSKQTMHKILNDEIKKQLQATVDGASSDYERDDMVNSINEALRNIVCMEYFDRFTSEKKIKKGKENEEIKITTTNVAIHFKSRQCRLDFEFYLRKGRFFNINPYFVGSLRKLKRKLVDEHRAKKDNSFISIKTITNDTIGISVFNREEKTWTDTSFYDPFKQKMYTSLKALQDDVSQVAQETESMQL